MLGVPLVGIGGDFFISELTDRFSQHFKFFGQRKMHLTSSSDIGSVMFLNSYHIAILHPQCQALLNRYPLRLRAFGSPFLKRGSSFVGPAEKTKPLDNREKLV
jgi:hypothetical protein